MKRIKTAPIIGAALLLYSVGATAQLTNQGMLDQVVTEFATRASSWQSVVMNAAMWLFWTLGTISLVWTGGMLILRKADIGEFFAEFVRFILFFGFFPVAAQERTGLCVLNHPILAEARGTSLWCLVGHPVGHRRYRLHDLEAGYQQPVTMESPSIVLSALP
jgi:type IV secretory pathway TrbL component